MTMLRCCFEPADLADRWPLLKQAYLCGMDDTAWHTWTDVRPGLLTCVAEIGESCACHVPWPVPRFGWLGLRTTTLPERSEPYDLNVELVRGKTARVHEIQRELEEAGLEAARRSRGALREARALFMEMVYRAPAGRIAELSNECLVRLVELGDALVLSYARLVCEQRQQLGQMPLVTARVTPETLSEIGAHELASYTDTVQILAPWSAIEREQGEYDWSALDGAVEACKKANLNVALGPLVCWDKLALPHWLWLYADRLDAILGFAREFVSAITRRYRDRVHVWELASRLNCGAALLFDSGDRLRLAVTIIEAAAEQISKGFTYITVGQPWSEYSARIDDPGAYYFADTLSRVERGLSGIGIEITRGYGHGASWPRDLVDTAYLLARYGALGVPLVLTFAAPLRSEDGEQAFVQVEPPGEKIYECEVEPLEWLEHVALVGASRPNVAALVWSHLGRNQPGMYPGAGYVEDGELRGRLFSVLKCQTSAERS